MVTLNAHFDGKVIVPDEPTGLPAGTRLHVTLEPVDTPPLTVPGRLDLPLLTGVELEVARSIVLGHEFDIESIRIDRFALGE